MHSGHEFEPVLHGLELLDGAGVGFNGHSSQARGAHRGQHVLNVVIALERNLTERHDCFDRAIRRAAIDDMAVLDPGALVDRVID